MKVRLVKWFSLELDKYVYQIAAIMDDGDFLCIDFYEEKRADAIVTFKKAVGGREVSGEQLEILDDNCQIIDI